MTYDTIANVAVNGLTVTGIVGLTVTPLPNLRIGASYRPRSVLTQSGTLRLDYSPLAQGTAASATGKGTSNGPDPSKDAAGNNDASGIGPTTLSAVFPGELKSGIDWGFGFGDVELDFNYTQWSQYQESVLLPQYSLNTSVSGTAQIPPVYLIHGFQDAWALRLGADFDIPIPGIRLTLRAGGGYESNAYNESKTQFVTVNFANFSQIYCAVGATVGFAWFDFDVAYSHVYMPEDDVRNSGTQAVVNNQPSPTAPVVGWQRQLQIRLRPGRGGPSCPFLALGDRRPAVRVWAARAVHVPFEGDRMKNLFIFIASFTVLALGAPAAPPARPPEPAEQAPGAAVARPAAPAPA